MKDSKLICDETCDNCIYIGEGDYICDAIMEIVIEEWCPIYDTCIAIKGDNNG